MSLKENFPVGVNVKIKKLYLDENIPRWEEFDLEEFKEVDKKNIERLIGCVGVVSGYEIIYGFESQKLVIVDFPNEEYYYFSEFELEVVGDEVSCPPPKFKEVENYTRLSEKEIEFAEKLFLKSFDKDVALGSDDKIEKLADYCLFASRRFYNYSKLNYSDGVKIIQENKE